MDLGIFQETKLTDNVYTRRLSGYSIVETNVPIRHRGGVTVFYRSSPRYAVEAVHKFGTNVVGFHLDTGEQRWYIFG